MGVLVTVSSLYLMKTNILLFDYRIRTAKNNEEAMDTVVHRQQCTMITLMHTVQGELRITSSHVYFFDSRPHGQRDEGEPDAGCTSTSLCVIWQCCYCIVPVLGSRYFPSSWFQYSVYDDIV